MNIIDLGSAADRLGVFIGGQDQDAARGTALGPTVPIPAEAPEFDQVLGLLGRDPAGAAR